MEKVSLRYATESDAVFLFDLVNDPECRRNSLNSDRIVFESHVEWLEGILCSDMQKLYILIDGDEPVGQGRLELRDEGCRISYSIIPERRGYGYGGVLLKLLNNAILTEFPSCRYSYGEVLQHNVASQKIFEELGYEARKVKDVYYYRKLVEYYEITEIDVKNRGGGYFNPDQ